MNEYERKQEARRDRLQARADRLTREGEGRIARGRDMASIIPFGQPILVGHHSEKRDRSYRAKIRGNFEKGFEALKEAGEAAARAASVGTGGVSSDDPEAVAKLREQLAEREADQAAMVAANKLARREGTPQPYAAYQLTNNGGNVRRIAARIADLERAATRTDKETLHNSGVRVFENAADNRIQLFFPGKPESTVRDMLKKWGFRWSPNAGAWQRHLNNAGRHAAQYVLSQLPTPAQPENPNAKD